MERLRGSAEEYEASAVEVDDERELGGGGERGWRGRMKNANGCGDGSVEAAVIEEDSGVGIEVGEDGGERGETNEGVVWVEGDM